MGGPNQAGGSEPHFQRGRVLTDRDLNDLSSLVLGRLLAQPPLRVQPSARGAVISMTPKPPGPRGAAGNSVFLARVTDAGGAPTSYQVDVYKNGYDADPTKTGVEAFPVDDATASFAPPADVAVFDAAGFTWILTNHPWTTAGAIFAGKIDVNGGDGTYTWHEMTFPGASGTDKPGGRSGVCEEWTGSSQVSEGSIVRIEQYTNGLFYFFYPLG